jgi:hypothetical protein
MDKTMAAAVPSLEETLGIDPRWGSVREVRSYTGGRSMSVTTTVCESKGFRVVRVSGGGSVVYRVLVRHGDEWIAGNNMTKDECIAALGGAVLAMSGQPA